MTAKIIPFPTAVSPAPELLELIRSWGVESLVAMGKDRDGGSFFVVSTGMTNCEVLWMLETSKSTIMS